MLAALIEDSFSTCFVPQIVSGIASFVKSGEMSSFPVNIGG